MLLIRLGNPSKNMDAKVCYLVVESGYGIVYNVLFSFACALLNYRLVLHHHTAFHTLNKSRKFDIFSRILPRDTQHIVLSESMRRDLMARYPHVQNVGCLHNAAFMTTPSIHRSTDRDFFTLGVISNLCRDKGVHLSIATFRHLIARGHKVKMIIAGPINDDFARREIEAILRQYPLSVEYLGFVNAEKKSVFFEAVDVTLFPSLYRYEAQPLSILESLQYGKPCLALSAGYIGEMLKGLGWIYSNDANYPEWAVGKLEEWLASTPKYLEHSTLARDRFELLKAKGVAQLLPFLKSVEGRV
jgi:glycosyltransferase involved in cell wall biosynthesis